MRFIVLVMIVAAILADFIAPYDPVVNAYDRIHLAPQWAQLAGHRSVRPGYSVAHHLRRPHRACSSASPAPSSAPPSGLILGVASAYFGGYFDLIFQRVMDVFMSFPLIILALALVAIFGGKIENDVILVIVAITIPFVPRCARVVRSNALAIREIPYVDAARALGYSHTRIIMRHMVPNVMAPYLIMITAFVGQAILLEASLSYLGLGVQEPTPAWGLMLQGGAEEYAESAPWIAVFPGLAITLAVFGFNLFGDALRDILDPRLRSR